MRHSSKLEIYIAVNTRISFVLLEPTNVTPTTNSKKYDLIFFFKIFTPEYSFLKYSFLEKCVASIPSLSSYNKRNFGMRKLFCKKEKSFLLLQPPFFNDLSHFPPVLEQGFKVKELYKIPISVGKDTFQ